MDRIQAGYWWRFARYEIRDGVIRPVKGATCEQYDPWALFEAARDGFQRPRQGKRMMEPPYQELFALWQRIEDRYALPQWAGAGPEFNRRRISDGGTSMDFDAQMVTDWCSRFGLLGILPQCASSITLPARWGNIRRHFTDMAENPSR